MIIRADRCWYVVVNADELHYYPILGWRMGDTATPILPCEMKPGDWAIVMPNGEVVTHDGHHYRDITDWKNGQG